MNTVNTVSSTRRAQQPASRSRLAAGAAALALVSMLGACAAPVTRTTEIYETPNVGRPAQYARVGTVERIEVVDTRAEPTGGGAAIGGVVGGLVGNIFGHGGGRVATTILGAVGGAVIGNKVEHNQANAESGRVYKVFVRFDDGETRRFDYRDLDGLRTGERVRLDADGILDRA